jgi:hypothetical protein
LPNLDDDSERPAQSSQVAKAVPVATPPPLASTGGTWSKWLLRVGIEVVLISMGVFLALMGEQWRENARTREMVETSLRRFREEIQTNRRAVVSVMDYHANTAKVLEAHFTNPRATPRDSFSFQGLQPAVFEHAAWDLALATQSLAHIDPQIALALSRTYNRQENYAGLTEGIVHAVYLRPPSDGDDIFLRAVEVYFGDLGFFEPELVRLYDDLLVQIDRAFGESPAAK